MKKIVVAAVCALSLSLTLAASESVTAGWLVSRLAAARGLEATSPEVASASLAGTGVRIPADLRLDQTLTEASVVRIAASFGIPLTTQRPDAAFTRAQAEAFLSTLGSDLAAKRGPVVGTNDVGGLPNPNSDNGKGKKKGHNRSASEPLAGPTGR